MTDRELMQQALDALEAMQSYAVAENKGLRICDEAIEALRARLDEWERVNMNDHKEGDLGIGAKPYAAQAAMVAQQTQGRMYVDPVTGDVGIGTVKPQREWQTLTDDEIRIAWGPYFSRGVDVARVIEAMLKRKNT